METVQQESSPFDEAARLAALRSYGVLDTEPDERFDRIAGLAARLTGAPIALVSLVDAERQFFKAHLGIDVCETPRSVSFCTHAITSDAPLVVEDLTRDGRFADNPFVIAAPHLRFYAGVPLRTSEGHRLGTLSVLDTVVRSISPGDLGHLVALAALAVDELELTRHASELEAQTRELETRTAELERAQARTQGVLDSIRSGFFALDADWCLTHMNLAAEPLLQRRREELIGENLWERFPEAIGGDFYRHYHDAARKGVVRTFEAFFEPLKTWFEVRAYPFEGGLSVYFDDVTERHDMEAERARAQAEIERSERRYRALTTAAASVVWRMSPDGASSLELIGGSLVDIASPLITAATWRDVLHPDDRARVAAEWAEIVRRGEQGEMEYRVSMPDGEVRCLRVRAVPVRTASGEIEEWIGANIDITEERLAHTRLLESEARFRSLVQNSSEVVTLVGPDGAIAYQSPSIERVMGHTPDSRIGGGVLDHIHPDDAGRVREALGALLGGAPEAQVHYRYLHADGSVRWGESSALNRLGDPHVAAIVVTTRDVTARVTAQRQLEESEQKYRALVEQSGQLVYEHDIESTAVAWSGNIAGITGHTAEAFKSMGTNAWSDRLHPDDAARTLDRLDRAMRAGAPFDAAYRFRHADGGYRHIEESGIVLPPGATGAARIIGVMTDVTARVESAEAIARSEDRYRSLSRLVQTFAFSYRVPGDGMLPVIEWVTGSVEDVIGWSAEDLVGRRWGTLQGDPAAGERLASLLAGETRADDIPVRGKDGRTHWVRHHMRPEVDPESGRVVRIHVGGRDVTVHKEAEAALIEAREESDRARQAAERAREQAEEMASLKDAFLANMSHEIRTPLTAILGFAALLHDEVSEPGREFVEIIEAAGQRLKDTLTSVLELSQLQAGRIHLTDLPLDVAHMVRETADILREHAAGQGVDLRVDLPGSLPAVMDRTALNRILTNLVSNAIRFTPQGSVTVSARADGPWLDLAVADTGIGISEAYLPHLFEEFRQESSGLAREYEGAGLGLAICQHLAGLMGGSIAVESQKGVGSTFTVRLPLRLPDARDARAPDADSDAARGPHVRRRVLVVEDIEETLHLLEILLADSHDATLVSTPEAALAASGPFDVVVLDINLGAGRMTGLDLLPLLRASEACREAHIVAVTAYALPGDEERLLEAGFDGYVAKPFEPIDLLAHLDIASDTARDAA